MVEPLIQGLAAALMGLAAIGVLYLIAAHRALRRFLARPADAAAHPAAVSILKPLRGADAELLGNLRSFCRQTHPAHQLVCGVAEATDPAVPAVQRLIAEAVGAAIRLVIDPASHGRNRKVSNLINMLTEAAHPVLAISDSDMRVDPSYLGQVTGPLADPGIGIVTCLYLGKPADPGLWSALGSLFINHQFLPMALLGRSLGESKGCFGASMVFRRADLEAAGGFQRIADLLADDYALGALMREQGKRVHLSRYLITDMVSEPSLGALVAHELRWARTIRTLAPGSHLGTVVTHPVALALLASIPAAAAGLGGPALGLLLAALLLRLLLVRLNDRLIGLEPARLGLVPARDLLSFVVWCASFWGKSVRWRGDAFRVESDGRLV